MVLNGLILVHPIFIGAFKSAPSKNRKPPARHSFISFDPVSLVRHYGCNISILPQRKNWLCPVNLENMGDATQLIDSITLDFNLPVQIGAAKNR